MVSNTLKVLDDTGIVARLEGYTSFEWVREFQAYGSFKLSIPAEIAATAEIIKGRRLLPPDNNVVYLIEQVQHSVNGSDDTLAVSGRGIPGMFTERLCLPPVGLAYDTVSAVNAEFAAKHYVDSNAASSAATNRQLPGLLVATNQNRGNTVTLQARYQYLADALNAICKAGGLGYEVTYNGTNYIFDIIPTTDKSASVIFDIDLETALALDWLSSDLGTKNYSYVAGQGTGAARTIVQRYSTGLEPTGFNRRELFIDARDLTDSNALATRGDAKLAEVAQDDSFDVDINPVGSFQYRTDFDLGDIITVRHKPWNLTRTAQVIKITQKIDTANSLTPSLSVVLNKDYPSLKSAVTNFVLTPQTAD